MWMTLLERQAHVSSDVAVVDGASRTGGGMRPASRGDGGTYDSWTVQAAADHDKGIE